MFTYSEEYYTEVKTVKSTITYVEFHANNQVKSDTILETTAQIKLFDGEEWREKTIQDVRDVQETIDRMVDQLEKEKTLQKANERVEQNHLLSIVQKKELHDKKQRQFQNIPGRSGRLYHYGDRNITHIPLFMKQNLCKDFYTTMCAKASLDYFTRYEDRYSSISVVDSNGHDLLYDEQKITVSMCLEDNVEEMCNIAGSYFDEIAGQKTEWQSEISRILDKEL